MLRRVFRAKTQQLTQSNLRYNKYYLAGKRIPWQYPGEADNYDPEPVGDVYKYIYNPEDVPDVGYGYHTKKHDPYLESTMYSFDNWQFEYEGQWWDIAGVFGGLLYLLTPLYLIWVELQIPVILFVLFNRMREN